MKDFAAIVSSLNLLGLGGLGIFIWYIVRGLRERIVALTQLAEEQRKTLDVVRTRAVELDQLRKDYRQALDDFQDIGHKLEERRNAVIRELEAANKQKDDELARLKQLELEEIELKKRSFDRLPQLEERLTSTVQELARQIRVVAEGSSWPLRLTSSGPSNSWDILSHDEYPTVIISGEHGAGKTLLSNYLLKRLLLDHAAASATTLKEKEKEAPAGDKTIEGKTKDPNKES